MNPWAKLPDKPDYIAPTDKLALLDPKFKIDGYRFDAFPDPYVGNLDNANVVFLALNPGFEQADIDVNLVNEYFIKESRLNLTHQSTVPFFYLMDELKETFGYKWWTKILGPMMREENIGLESIRNKIMIIEYMPYHSRSYKHSTVTLPSQHYSFDLVRRAIDQKKTIVILRSKKIWREAVPELDGYPYLELSNVQTSWISRKNLTSKSPPGSFDKLVEQLR